MRVKANRNLLPEEKALLDFAARHYRFAGAREEAIRTELGMSSTTFWRKVNDLLDDPAALAYDPVTVNRYRRIVDAGTTSRRPAAARLA